MYKKSANKSTNAICDIVLAKLLAQIEQGIIPWHKPWTQTSQDGAISYTTRKPYSLLNQILLGFRSGNTLPSNR